MDNIWVTVLVAGLTAIAGGIGADIWLRIKYFGKGFQDKRKTERMKEMTEVVEQVIDAKMNPKLEKIEQDLAETRKLVDEIRSEDIAILKKANRDSIRCQLYEIYDKCSLYKTAADIENESELFNSYKNLEGNHGCDARHEIFERLPIREK